MIKNEQIIVENKQKEIDNAHVEVKVSEEAEAEESNKEKEVRVTNAGGGVENDDSKRKFVKLGENRKGKVIAISPEKKEDMSKAIVVFGSTSSMSEVVASFEKVRLKRNALEVEDGREVKRRKLMFDAIKDNNVVQDQIVRKEERKSVRNIRRQIRKPNGGTKKWRSWQKCMFLLAQLLRKGNVAILLGWALVAGLKHPPKSHEYFM